MALDIPGKRAGHLPFFQSLCRPSATLRSIAPPPHNLIRFPASIRGVDVNACFYRQGVQGSGDVSDSQGRWFPARTERQIQVGLSPGSGLSLHLHHPFLLHYHLPLFFHLEGRSASLCLFFCERRIADSADLRRNTSSAQDVSSQMEGRRTKVVRGSCPALTCPP